MKLKKKRFGRTDLRISEFGLSTSNFSRYASQEESFAILDSFRDAGGNFIQTSGICPGVNLGDGFLGIPEEVLGRWLELRNIDRTSITLATAGSIPCFGRRADRARIIAACPGSAGSQDSFVGLSAP